MDQRIIICPGAQEFEPEPEVALLPERPVHTDPEDDVVRLIALQAAQRSDSDNRMPRLFRWFR